MLYVVWSYVVWSYQVLVCLCRLVVRLETLAGVLVRRGRAGPRGHVGLYVICHTQIRIEIQDRKVRR
jgi:hypothetical protein